MTGTLQAFSIFQDLAPEQLEAVAALCQGARARKGEQIFAVGDPARSLYLVGAGQIELRFAVHYANAPVEIVLDRKTSGDIFGWSALIPPHRYTLSAHAAEDSDLWRIEQADLLNLCEANSRLGFLIMKNIARVIGERFELAEQMLIREIRHGLQRQDPLA